METVERYEVLRILIHSGLSEDGALAFSGIFDAARRESLREYINRARSGKRGHRRRTEEDAIPLLEGPEPEFTMALYNSYKGKADDSHYRNIARAAALCYAFDIKLALIGFPFKNAEECVEKTAKNTRIGKGGLYLRELYRADRFVLHGNFSDIKGTTVATTSHPEPEKQVELGDIRGKAVFILGTGHQGLPESVLKGADFHMEFTGKGASLETCTAMGVLAHILGSLKRKA